MTIALDIAEISERTLHHAFSVITRTPRGEVAERPSLLMTSTGTQHAGFNRGFVRAPLTDPAAVVAEMTAFYDERGLPFVSYVPAPLVADFGPAALDAGLTSTSVVEGMIASSLPAHSDVPGLEISAVTGDDAAMEWLDASARGFGAPVEAFIELFPPSMALDPAAVWLLGRVNGVPVANACLVVTDEIAGIYSISTNPEYRRRGFGAAMTTAAIAEGAKRGCTVAALQPTEAGRPVYTALGFRAAAVFVTFARPAGVEG